MPASVLVFPQKVLRAALYIAEVVLMKTKDLYEKETKVIFRKA